MPKPEHRVSKPVKPRKPVRNTHGTWITALPADWPKHAAILAAIIFFAFLAYSNSFSAGFPADNGEIILKDTRIREATADNIHRILTSPYWEIKLAGLYRPLSTLSFLFNYATLGDGASPAGYHWINFGLHAVNIALVYVLGLLLLEEAAPAALVAAIWAVHPVLTESVTNLVGRADLLAAFGVLAALLAWIRARGSSGKPRLAWLAAVALASAIGIFSKESAVVAVAILILYDVCFPAAETPPASAGNSRQLGRRARWHGYAAAALPSVFYLMARAHALARLPYEPFPFVDNPLTAAGFWTSSLTAVKIIGKYLFLLVWPRRLSCDYSYNAIPLFAWNLGSWEDWKAILALLLCLAAVLAAFRSFRRNRLVLFAVGFFFVTLSPTSNLAFRMGSIMAERFLYLPSIGFFILIIGIPGRSLYVRRHWKAAAAVAAVLLLLAAWRTLDRNLDWGDEQRLWSSAIEASPGSYKPLLMAASIAPLADPEAAARAIAEMDRAVAILDPLPDLRSDGHPWLDAGVFYRSIGDHAAAANRDAWYRRSLALLLRSEQIEFARQDFNRRENARRGRPGLTFLPAELYLELGRTYMRLSDFEPARAAFERGRALASDPDLLQELAELYRREGNLHGAAAALIEAFGMDSTRTTITPMLIQLYRQVDPAGCSVTRSGELDLTCPLVHTDICRASHNVIANYLRRGQVPEAAAIRQGALQDLGCTADLLDR